MKTILKSISIILLIIGLQQVGFSQEAIDSTKIYQVETADGNKYVGKIISKDKEVLTIETELVGTLTIKMDNVKFIDEIDSARLIEGQYWTTNLNSRRYFFGPSALSLKKGEGYYQNSMVFFNQVSYGFTDNFTMGAGLIPLFLFDTGITPIWLTPKLAFKASENLHFGVGGLFLTVIGESEGFAGVTYGLVTVGNPDINLTAGLGFGFISSEWADRPTLSLSGMARVSKRTYLMTENYFLGIDGDGFGLSFVGARTSWDRVSLDYGLLIPFSEDNDFIGIPWLSLVIPFRQSNKN